MKRNSAFTTWQCVSNLKVVDVLVILFWTLASCRSRYSRLFVCFVLVSVFFSSTGLRIRVCKRVELEAHFSVHHLAGGA